MRLFFALLPPPQVRAALAGAQKELVPLCTSGGFSRPENLHITVVFLGEQPQESLPALRRAATKAAASLSAFPITVEGFGSFSSREGSVLWAGVGEGRAEAERLYALLADELRQNGFAIETRAFTPHLTLARRVRADEPGGMAALAEGWALPPQHFTAGALSLMESTRENGLLRYTELFQAPFGKKRCLAVRELTAEDYRAAAAVARSVFDEVLAYKLSPQGRAAFARHASVGSFHQHQGESVLLGAFDGDSLVGVLELRDKSRVSLLCVLHRTWNHGAGRALLTQAARLCTQAGGRALVLDAPPSTVPPLRRLGFSPAGMPRQLFGLDFLPMEKRLAPGAEHPDEK